MTTFNNFVNELENQSVTIIVEDIFHEAGVFVEDPYWGKSIYLSPLQSEEEKYTTLVHETVHYIQTLEKGAWLIGEDKSLREYNPKLTFYELKTVHRHLLTYPRKSWVTEKAAFALQYYPDKVFELLIS